MRAIASWCEGTDVAAIAASSVDLVVVDPVAAGRFRPAADVARMQTRPGGGRRLVIAALSIGSIERDRPWWNPAWSDAPPPWLLPAMPGWHGSHAVHVFDPLWQRQLVGTPNAPLDVILETGFDGVLVDAGDIIEHLETSHPHLAASRPDLDRDVVDLIVRLAAQARSRRPDIAVLAHGVDALLAEEALREAIDGVVREDLLYGANGGPPGRPSPKDEIRIARRNLDLARRAGKPVFVLERLDDPALARAALETLTGFGYIGATSTATDNRWAPADTMTPSSGETSA